MLIVLLVLTVMTVLVNSESVLRLWLLCNLQMSNVTAQRSNVLLMTSLVLLMISLVLFSLKILLMLELVHVNSRRLEEDRRVDRFGDVMFKFRHRRVNLNIRSEVVLDEVVLLLPEVLIMALRRRRLDELRSLVLMSSEIWSGLLDESTSENVLVLDVLEVLSDCVLVVLVQWLSVMLMNLLLVGSEVERWTLPWWELLLLLVSWELRSVELLRWPIERRQLLVLTMEVLRWTLTRRQMLALWSLKVLLEIWREVLGWTLELLLLLWSWLIRESHLLRLLLRRMGMIVEWSLILIEIS